MVERAATDSTVTRVVNVRFAEGYDVYIGRNGTFRYHLDHCQLCRRRPLNLCSMGLATAWFGNPFTIGRDGDRDKVLELSEQYARDRIAKDINFRNRVRQLWGKTLGCWCKREDQDVKCHGDVYAVLAEELHHEGR